MTAKRLSDMMSWEKLYEKVSREADLDTPDFKAWFMTKNIGGSFVDSKTYAVAYHIQKNLNKKDGDNFTVICAKEGYGKSTLAIQLACLISPDFVMKNICFEQYPFIEGIQRSTKGNVLLLDEANLVILSRDAMSSGSKLMLKLFALQRQRNLAVIICVPSFWTLDTYIREHRVDRLFYIKKRGSFTSYNNEAVKLIAIHGSSKKSIESVTVPHGTFFYGHFNKHLPTLNDIDEKSYREYKADVFDDFLESIKSEIKGKEVKSEYISIAEAQKIIPLSQMTYVRMIKEGKIIGKKLGLKWFLKRNDVQKGDFRV